MLFSRVFVHTEPRSINQNLRRSTSLAPAALRPRHIPPRYEKSATATPLVPANYKCPLAQILSLHILTNAPGVWGSALSFLKFYLNSFAKSSVITCPSPLFSPFLFMRLHTLSFSVACKSFACLPAVAGHSYKNCRVYTNNSHSETQRRHEQALALTREAKQHTFRHRWNPSPSADEKPITCRSHRCWNDCDCGIAAGERATCGVAGAGDGAAALAGDHSNRGECHVPAIAHRLDFGGAAGRRGTGARRAFRRAQAAIPWHDFSAADQGDHRAAALRDARCGHRGACGLEESRAAGHQVARLFRNCFHDRAADRICGDQFEPRGRRRTAAAIHGGGNAERGAAHGDATHHGYFSGKHREVCRRRPGTASRGLQHFV